MSRAPPPPSRNGIEMVMDTTKGNSLIESQVADMLVKPLQASSVILGAPGVKVENSSTPIKFPKLTGNTNAGFVGENELIPESDEFDFGELTLMPTELKSVKAIVRVSNELIRMAKQSVSTVLQAKVVEDVRDVLDTALITSLGEDDTITGLLHSGIETAPFSTADPDSIMDGIAFMSGNEVTPTRIYMNGGDFFEMRKLKDGDGRYLLQADVSSGARFSLHGIPVTVTNKLPAGKAIMGNMADLVIVRDIDPTISILTERYADYDQTGIRVVARYDQGVLRDDSFLILDTAG